MNNPLISYLRHIITFYLTEWAIRLALPKEGLTQAIEILATSGAIFISWVVVKYLIPTVKAKFFTKKSKLP